MNTKLFSDAMSEIEDRYIHEALQYKNKRKKSGWMKWSVAAACLCIVAAGTFIWKQFATPLAKDKNTIIGNEEITIKEDGITIPVTGDLSVVRPPYGYAWILYISRTGVHAV